MSMDKHMDKHMDHREQVSALADGRLSGREFAAAVEFMADEGDARATWHVYHLVGDVLRSPELAECRQDRAFVERLRVRLAAELVDRPRVSDAIENIASNDRETGTIGRNFVQEPAANGEAFRWKLAAGVASFAAVAAIAWNLSSQGGGGAQLARSTPGAPPVLASSAQEGSAVVMIRDPQLDEFLAAHRQLGGASALQMPSGFLRNATFEAPAR